MKALKLICVLALVALTTGCGPGRPKEMPKTYPLTVVVKQGGQPMNEVTVTLHSEESQGKWTVAGTTDASGNAQVSTICLGFTDKGAPEGEFKVLLTGKPKMEKKEMPDERAMRSMSDAERKGVSQSREEYVAARKAATLFPPEFSNPKDTPFTISVTKDTKIVELDVPDDEK